MELTVGDSLSGRQTPVRPTRGRSVRMYVCGPTVYAPTHVGHARTYLYFDVARRFLEGEGTPVQHVMNVTDIEDKIDRRAKDLGISWRSLARREERAFVRDLTDLRILLPQHRPRASEFVREMARTARALARTGRLRHANGECLYDAPRRRRGENFPTGPELARHAVDEPGHPFPSKEGADRAIQVWKRQEPPLPSWPGPFGRGVPGWHLECVVMARRFLRLPVDLHGGGRDLVYPHHYAENEMALALDRCRFSRAFLHTGFVLQRGRKMSKSIGNTVPLRAALRAVGPDAIRWFLLSAPYSERTDWDPRQVERAAVLHARTRRAIARWLAPGGGGRWGAARAQAVAHAVRTDLARGLRTDRVFPRLAEFAARLDAEPSGAVARGERRAALAAVRSIEERLGVALT
jgi:cysteinyl-tRNA synthetase